MSGEPRFPFGGAPPWVGGAGLVVLCCGGKAFAAAAVASIMAWFGDLSVVAISAAAVVASLVVLGAIGLHRSIRGNEAVDGAAGVIERAVE